MKYNLKSNNILVEVDTKGAYVDSFTYKGKEVFFSKRIIVENGSEKVRGGSHICFPHFGPCTKVNLENHGFGRSEEWKVKKQSENEIVLVLNNDYSDWKDVEAEVTYKIDEESFETKLLVKNNGEKEIYITPGFHPYFSYENEEEIYINDEKYKLTPKLIDSIFMEGIYSFETSKYKLKYENTNMNKFVLWTSFSGKFLCVEPSYNLKALDDDEKLEKVESKGQKEFSYKLTVINK